jgi:hypothetical protein
MKLRTVALWITWHFPIVEYFLANMRKTMHDYCEYRNLLP